MVDHDDTAPNPGMTPGPGPATAPLPWSSPPSAAPSSPPLMAPVLGSGTTYPLPSTPPGYDQPPGSTRPFTSPSGPLTALPALPALPTRPATAPGRRRSPSVLIAIAVVSALLASLLTAGIVVAFDRGGSTTSATAGNSLLANRAGLDIQALLSKAQPSVVSIQTGERSSVGVFGAAGSGVVISDDGLVLTNAHVIAAATTMQVTLSDGRSVAADLVGSLPDDDVALIRLRDASGLTPADLGNSADVRVGDDVVAIGNALNLGGPPSVTEGIISAKDRTIQAEKSTLRNLIQTDAAINPGNSGGPLLDAAGEVVGINTAIISDAQNIGFAIAIDSVKPLIQAIKDGQGTITPDTAFLGVSTQAVGEIAPDVLAQYGVRTRDGAFVADIQPGAAAGDAGLQLGDVITAIDGQPMSGADTVIAAVREHRAGDSVTITYERGGKTANVTVELRSRGQSGD
jgi:S1-C subfamily serine protease